MKGIGIWTEAPYQEDRLFDPRSSLNRDDCLHPFRTLRSACADRGFEMHTQDVWMRSAAIPQAILFLDLPARGVEATIGPWYGKTDPYLLLQECEVVLPSNWDLQAHLQFRLIFTWHSELIKQERYVRAGFSQHIRIPAVDGWAGRPHHTCIIAGNKRAQHRNELYSARVAAIDWFERHHPEHFALFGTQWDRFVPPGPQLLRRILRRFETVAKALAPKRPSYRGPVPDKRACLLSHRFNICFENARNIPGYITEKLFDSMMAGCLPIYWGAPDIADHVPKECFIDFREFSGFPDLYRFLQSLDESAYRTYQEAMRAYLSSDACFPFTSEHFAKQIADAMLRSRT